MNVSVSNFNNLQCSPFNLLSDDDVSHLVSLGFTSDDNFSYYSDASNIPACDVSVSSSVSTVIAYRTFIDKFFTKCLKKRTKIPTILLNQLIYLQAKSKDVRNYLEEERKNLVNLGDTSKQQYNHGYISGYMLKDYANICTTTESTISKTLKYFENRGYITKASIAFNDSNNLYEYGESGESKYYNPYKQERIQIRLNIINLFKDFILCGLVSLDEYEFLPSELIEVYKDVRLVLKCSQIIEFHDTVLADEQVETDSSQKLDYNVLDLINIYNQKKGAKLTQQQIDDVKFTLDEMVNSNVYSVEQIALAIDNYEIFRNITNRHGKYMKSAMTFFTNENINDYIDKNFQSMLERNIFSLNASNSNAHSKLLKNYKSFDVASQMQIARKLNEKNEAQRKFDMYVELLRKSVHLLSVDELSTNSQEIISSTASLLSNCKYDVSTNTASNIGSHIENDNKVSSVCEMGIDVNKLIHKQSTKNMILNYYKRCSYQDKVDFEDIVNEVYLTAVELLAVDEVVYSDEKSLLKAVIYKLRKKLYELYGDKNKEVNVVPFGDDVYSNDLNLFLQASCNDYNSWSFNDLFDSDFSNEKIVYQLLFCLATNDEIVKDVPFAHSRLLNGYLFCKGSEDSKVSELMLSFGYNDKSSVSRLLKQFFANIEFIIRDYCQAHSKPLTQLVLADELIVCDDECSLSVENGAVLYLRVDDVFEHNCYIDASQLSDVSALRDVSSGFVKLVEYVAFRLANVKVNASLTKRLT